MTARELYKAIGVAGYETLGCCRKEGIFHLRCPRRPRAVDAPRAGTGK